MRVLVLGSGGREHALAWKIAQSDRATRVMAAPGSAAIADVATCFPDVAAGDQEGVVALASRESADLVVVGPEDPLASGIADRLREAGIATFGPSQQAAQLESSKTFAKDFMGRHQIPTARYAFFDDAAPAIDYAQSLGGPCVVKADGLAAGKGVYMCETPEVAERALQEIMRDGRFGAAGARVVIEEWMRGEEASYYAVTDGERVVILGAAQDYKRALDGDEGENTGGMGAYSPAPVLSEDVEKRVLEEIVHPTVRGMAAEGRPYQGVLYVGLMIEAGRPRVVEFNVRFGDPETQVLVVRMESDLLPILQGAASGSLDESTAVSSRGAAVCVVLASGGYPRSYATGLPIKGLDVAEGDPDLAVFHAGTTRNAEGGFETAGGRVVGVTARGPGLREARDRAYAAADRIRFEGAHLRRDVAARALGRER